jgi:hypothetical protein
LKLNCDESLSNVASNFNLRRYDGAAKSGNLEMLKWARERGCEWDEMTSTGASAGGHLDMLTWAR